MENFFYISITITRSYMYGVTAMYVKYVIGYGTKVILLSNMYYFQTGSHWHKQRVVGDVKLVISQKPARFHLDDVCFFFWNQQQKIHKMAKKNPKNLSKKCLQQLGVCASGSRVWMLPNGPFTLTCYRCQNCSLEQCKRPITAMKLYL